jgi:CheY-like chemotaxis protein
VRETSHLRVLVIDDSPRVSELWRQALELVGHQVDTAATGSEGVALFERSRHDVVVTDLFMPGLSGWDAIEGVRALVPAEPVVLVTGNAVSEEDLERARAGRIPLLLKPIRIEQLETAVIQAVATSGCE